jgi:serine/threonine protein kinase
VTHSVLASSSLSLSLARSTASVAPVARAPPPAFTRPGHRPPHALQRVSHPNIVELHEVMGFLSLPPTRSFYGGMSGPHGGGGGVRWGLQGDGIEGVRHGRGRIQGIFAVRLALRFSQTFLTLGLLWVCLGVDGSSSPARQLLTGGKIKKPIARCYFRQLVSAVDFCHAGGVFHRDLKPESLLIDDTGSSSPLARPPTAPAAARTPLRPPTFWITSWNSLL